MNAPLKILHVWYADYPWDVRVEKVITGLRDAGMTVTLIARNKRRSPLRERLDGAEVYRMRWIGTRGRVSGWLNAVSSVPAFVNPRWLIHIYRVGRATLPDLILVRDLPLAPVAIWVGKMLRVPVVLDMAENYPDFLRSLRDTGALRPWDLLLRNPSIATVVERYVIQRVQAVVCVIEESAHRLMRLGVPEERIHLVRNTPQIDVRLLGHRRTAENDVLTIVYLGLVERHRGVQDLVRAVSECSKRGSQLRLIVIGDGKGLEELRSLAAGLGVLGNGVELLGRVENRRALSIVAAADIGAIPHMPCAAWDTTIPNKLFDYMLLALPVITSNVKPAQRIVHEEKCGLSYEWGNIQDLLVNIDMMRSPAVRRDMGEAGRRAVLAKYNWSNDGALLARSLLAVHDGVRTPPILHQQ